MIIRTLAMTRAALLETLRSRIAPLVALALVSAAPLTCIMFGDDLNRDWLARNSIAEGFSLLLPLAGVMLGAFALRPQMDAGWSMLPARRTEHFLSSALGAGVLIASGAALFALGGLIAAMAYGGELVETTPASGVNVQELKTGQLLREGKDGALSWANPRYDEALNFDVRAGDSRLRGVLEFEQVYWYTDAPPTRRAPVKLYVNDAVGTRAIDTHVLSHKRIEFDAEVDGEDVSILAVSNDSVFIIGASPDMLRLEVNRVSPMASIAALLGLSLGAAMLCLLFTLMVRSRATPATAALAGMLLVASLTLLPSLAPARKMSHDRRADMEGDGTSMTQTVSDNLDNLPHLVPNFAFEEFVAGRAVNGDPWLQGLARLGVGVLLLLPGALLYTRRQIAT